MVLTATQHKWKRPTITPASQAGTRLTYPGGMEGWVDLGSLIAARMGIEPTTAWSQVRCPNCYANESLLGKYGIRLLKICARTNVYLCVKLKTFHHTKPSDNYSDERKSAILFSLTLSFRQSCRRRLLKMTVQMNRRQCRCRRRYLRLNQGRLAHHRPTQNHYRTVEVYQCRHHPGHFHPRPATHRQCRRRLGNRRRQNPTKDNESCSCYYSPAIPTSL